MLTTEVFRPENLIERKFSVRQTLAIDPRVSASDADRVVKRDLCRLLADEILLGGKRDNFFWKSHYQVNGRSFLEYGVDVVVFTTTECRELQRAAFEDGMRFGQGYVTKP